MERLRQTKYEYERLRADYEHDEDRIGRQAIKQREKALRDQFREIIQHDKKNAEVHYRYGYFWMEKGEYLNAITNFEKALRKNDSSNVTFPLEKAQEIKAHMFIGYCAGQLVKHSLAKVNELNVEEAQFDFGEIEGKSLDEVLDMLKYQSEHYLAFHNGEKRSLSLEEYLKFKAGDYGDVILISFIESEVFIKVGPHNPKALNVGLGEKLRLILEKILKNGVITYDDFRMEYPNANWRAVNQTMTRINQRVRESGLRILEIPEGTFQERYPQKIQLAATNYIVVFRQSDFAE
ncbi:hypothetical protein D1B33_12530 [Lysinibacillus yapensis]|uniref:Uncharacterized protein n=1 Tax=Ureibacillus yapensis TaxID=2304605 RepID=A0A396S5Y7_9BACL|nr:hypothetical protein [Lysinibacillus yapensis]RHW35913.1 hypothetical protein D1B33_12530 [Lysinibacillus yapensis]